MSLTAKKKIEQTRATKTHQKYFVQDGTQVPGATTVLSVLNKPALVAWANRIGLEGVAVGAYVDSLASIGKAAHGLLEAQLQGEEFDAGDYTPNELTAAQRSVAKYEEWAKKREVQIIASEVQMVSEVHRFGGTADAILMIDDCLTVCDFKTGKGIYSEHTYQAAAYAELAKENGYPIEAIRILNIPRSESESFQERALTDWSAEWGVFLAALSVYRAQKSLEKRVKEEVA